MKAVLSLFGCRISLLTSGKGALELFLEVGCPTDGGFSVIPTDRLQVPSSQSLRCAFGYVPNLAGHT